MVPAPGWVAAIVHVLPIPSEIAKVSILLAACAVGFLFGILFGVNYRLDSAQSRLHGDREHRVQYCDALAIIIRGALFPNEVLSMTLAVLYAPEQGPQRSNMFCLGPATHRKAANLFCSRKATPTWRTPTHAKWFQTDPG